MSDIIDIKEFRTRQDQEKSDHLVEEIGILYCPFCDQSMWSAAIEKNKSCIGYLFCASDICEGLSYIEVKDGVPDKVAYRLNIF